MTITVQELDQIDHDIACRKLLKFDAIKTPRCGDYIIFADGITRRISYVYGEEWEPEMQGVQTSDSGQWYFDSGGRCDFSGSLYQVVKMNTLTLTTETKMGTVWMFHHNFHTAGNGVYFEISFRVYHCSVNAPR